jgi:hypothetical protein
MRFSVPSLAEGTDPTDRPFKGDPARPLSFRRHTRYATRLAGVARVGRRSQKEASPELWDPAGRPNIWHPA